MAATRWGVFRTLATAVRTATRPGSPGLGERMAALPRLVRATLRGDYAGTTKGRLFMIAAALAYVVSPFDLVPEAFLTVFGLADDAMVVSWIAASLVNETESFLAWERSGDAVRAQARTPHDTVPGRVVR
jgi:uncharacterized membrane protein YkvA (DUF1232 family)